MKTKPRLQKDGECWRCAGALQEAYGFTPKGAYDSWLKAFDLEKRLREFQRNYVPLELHRQ